MSRAVEVELCIRGAVVQVSGTPDPGDRSVGMGAGVDDLTVVSWEWDEPDEEDRTFDGKLTQAEEQEAVERIIIAKQDELQSAEDEKADRAMDDARELRMERGW